MKNVINEYVNLSLSQFRQMEVIDINKGKRMGFISDIIFDDDLTKIEYIVLPSQGNIWSMFKKREEVLIKWEVIKVIGIDLVIVDTSEKNYESNTLEINNL